MVKQADKGWQDWLPRPGNVLLTLVAMAALVWASKTGAISLAPSAPQAPAASSTIIPYQGRLASASGAPISGQRDMTFRLYNTPSEGMVEELLWSESWADLQITNGLFNVLLGSKTALPFDQLRANPGLWLGIQVEADAEMSPRVQLGAALPLPVTESVYTLALSEDKSTTSQKEFALGMLTLPITSNLSIDTQWVLQNNSSDAGMRVELKIDGVSYDLWGGHTPSFVQGVAQIFSRDYYIPNMPAGAHAVSILINQPAFQSSNSINMVNGSKTWVRAVPAP